MVNAIGSNFTLSRSPSIRYLMWYYVRDVMCREEEGEGRSTLRDIIGVWVDRRMVASERKESTFCPSGRFTRSV